MNIYSLFPFCSFVLSQYKYILQGKQLQKEHQAGRQGNGKFDRKSFITYRLSELQIPFLTKQHQEEAERNRTKTGEKERKIL